MSQLKISTRLLLLLGLSSVLLLALGAMGLYGISQSNRALHRVYDDRMVPVNQLSQIQLLVQANRLAVTASVADTATISQNVAEIQANVSIIDRLWADYLATELTPEEVGLAKEFGARRQRFVQEALNPALKALQSKDDVAAAQVLHEKINPLFLPLNETATALVKLQFDEAKREYLEAENRFNSIRASSIGATLLGLLLTSAFGYLMVRSIGAQLGAEPAEAAALARGVAAGDLSSPIQLRPGDSSSLMAQLHDMQSKLAQVVTGVRRNSESVATASAEISQGNSDLSQRTEEQASALQQTAASMEQLTAVFQRNAEGAGRANHFAQNATAVAQRGGAVVAQVVDTMRGINDSSRQIADIIGVIDGIAFQTNILALNAAVEAARAGEQGRGFAVVASEVRNLAGRSAEAAREIKSLINASVERVERGSELVDQAGATMQEVVKAIEQVTQIVAEISHASGEQSIGFAQVGEAVNQMDKTTQQNAALVEESAAAAESLRRQAQSLLEMVEIFKLSSQGRHRA